jgi:hypothetical protein
VCPCRRFRRLHPWFLCRWRSTVGTPNTMRKAARRVSAKSRACTNYLPRH